MTRPPIRGEVRGANVLLLSGVLGTTVTWPGCNGVAYAELRP